MSDSNRHEPGAAGTVLISGASSGIGLELSKLFARDGFDLVLVARDVPRLTQLAETLKKQFSVNTKIIASDLAKPGVADQIAAQLQQESVSIDILVNNAGFGNYGRFTETDLAAELQLMQVNMVTLTHLTKLFLREMLHRGEGKILNVSSLVGFQPGGPFMAVYYATKAYVLSFSKALSNELRGTNITVTALCPGPTKTAFTKRDGIEDTRIYRALSMEASTVAKTGYLGLMKKKKVVIPGLANKLLAFGGEFPPRCIALEINRFLLGKS